MGDDSGMDVVQRRLMVHDGGFMVDGIGEVGKDVFRHQGYKGSDILCCYCCVLLQHIGDGSMVGVRVATLSHLAQALATSAMHLTYHHLLVVSPTSCLHCVPNINLS